MTIQLGLQFPDEYQRRFELLYNEYVAARDVLAEFIAITDLEPYILNVSPEKQIKNIRSPL